MKARSVALIIVFLGTFTARGADTVERFGVFETALSASGDAANPYVDLAAEAVLTAPDGRLTRPVPLFWDGAATWKFRFSPDQAGTWKWTTRSRNAGLDAKSGRFTVVDSRRRGSIRPMHGFPCHFERQDGSPFWFMGDTAWALFTDNQEEKHDRAAAFRYLEARGSQGFNVVHSMLLSEAGWGNAGGPPWRDLNAERINPAYWQEVDRRVARANEVGIVVGLALAWGGKGRGEPYAWGRFPSEAARERYARYIAARFSAFEVYFIVSGEWHGEARTRPADEVRREFVEIGNALKTADPHGRMVAIHPMTRDGSVREFNESAWMAFGDYQQNYRDLHARVLESPQFNKPVVNSEYGYYLRDQDGDGVPDKDNSTSLRSMRHATWDILMAGGYVVTGFGTTYFGGNRDPGPFDLETPKNKSWEQQMGVMKSLFTSLEWWRLAPHDELLECAAPRGKDAKEQGRTAPPRVTYWCLAEPGRQYVVYARGLREPVSLKLPQTGPLEARQFNPRTGELTEATAKIKDGRVEYRPPDEQDWVVRFASHGVLQQSGSRAASGEKAGTTPKRLQLGVVQMSIGQTLADNRDRIVLWIAKAAARGARVVVFPEGALRGDGSDQPASVDQAVAAIGRAAKEHRVYVVCGLARSLPEKGRHVNSMFVLGPDGRDVFRYDKLYDKHDAKMPGVFYVDGVPCGTMICADRWLRGIEEIPIQQGAQVSFELSCNFASEWVAPFGWYWYVPRALRNNVWVIFANSGNKVSGVSDTPDPRELRHGHSAIIAPDGRIVAAARDDVENIVMAEVDVNQATRAEAQARAAHPVLRPFWEAGVKLQSGQPVKAPPLAPLESAETDVTLAVAQATDNVAQMVAMVGKARSKGADLIALPERAIEETALGRLAAAAREHGITVVVGCVHREEKRLYNSAFVLGPDGSVLTRYDQLSATAPFEPGANTNTMWFRVKGVPAVVTIGRDAAWSELAELAAAAGAQIHVYLDHGPASTPEANLRRVQVWSNLASFQTFTATANVTGSAIWDDLRDLEERRAEVRGRPRPNSGAVEVYSPFSANLVVRAGDGPELILATRHVGKKNEYHPRRTSSFNPQMDAWYRLGAAILHPGIGDPQP